MRKKPTRHKLMLPYQLSIQTDQGIDHSEEGDHSKNHAKTLYDFPHRPQKLRAGRNYPQLFWYSATTHTHKSLYQLLYTIPLNLHHIWMQSPDATNDWLHAQRLNRILFNKVCLPWTNIISFKQIISFPSSL